MTDEIRPLRDVAHEHIKAVLVQLDGNKSNAAKRLGISLKTLYSHLNRHKLPLDYGSPAWKERGRTHG